MYRILIIDDDDDLGEMLTEYLQPDGFSLATSLRGDDGLTRAQRETWDAIILDVMLPGMNGFDVLKTIRQSSLVPVLMLTAKGDDLDKILGLEMGADDYLAKPFNPRELVARLRAILRRQLRSEAGSSGAELICQKLRMNPETRSVTFDGMRVDLTSTQFSVLFTLVEHAGKVVSKQELYRQALGRELTPHDRSIDMHISHLRAKLNSLHSSLVIHTIRGAGYQLEP